ncbi:unnamed protein product, partial [Discosporangium mesarthrocarpum]
ALQGLLEDILCHFPPSSFLDKLACVIRRESSLRARSGGYGGQGNGRGGWTTSLKPLVDWSTMTPIVHAAASSFTETPAALTALATELATEAMCRHTGHYSVPYSTSTPPDASEARPDGLGATQEGRDDLEDSKDWPRAALCTAQRLVWETDAAVMGSGGASCASRGRAGTRREDR